ncbi:MAG: HD domain-containing protein [Planctomycetota bacterium]
MRLAREAHAGQMRDGGRPAVLHVLRVAQAVLEAPGALDVQAVEAAALHDTLEDTRLTVAELRRQVGERVAELVQWVTLDELARYGGDKAARDRAYYERFERAPRSAQLVKFFDRRDNVRDMGDWPVEGKLGYLQATREKVIASLRPKSPDLAQALDAEVTALAERYAAELARAGEGLVRFRRADGTLQWRPLLAERAKAEGAGLLHFTLALFLKELAVVLETGDRLRIEEFFDGLASTDFFVHYGLFAAGARVGEVAYARYLARYIRPRFVSGLLRTNLALAAGLALPQLLSGHFDGEAFAVSVTALGLSTTAVRAGVGALKWVAELSGGSRALGLASGKLSLGKLGTVGGWLYTVGETAVVLYVADELEQAYRAWRDERAARAALGEAGVELFAALGRARDPEEADRALAAYGRSFAAWRDWLQSPLAAEEARLDRRLGGIARRAKLAADERAAALKGVERTPALRASIVARYGSLEAWLDARAVADEAALTQDAEAAIAAYQRAVSEGLTRLYREGARGGPLPLDLPDPEWLRAGLAPGAAGDPYGARGDVFASWGRRRARAQAVDALGGASQNRPESYADEKAVLGLALSQLRDRPELAARVRARLAEVDALAALDSKLVQGGLADALLRNR